MAFYPSELAADDASTPINAWSGSLTNPAAYGSVPAPTQPVSTSGAATGNAIAAGQEVNSQLPGYTQDLSNVGANITALTSGQVPADVIEQLQQQGAEENAVTGAGSNAAYLKALGLTSLGLDQTGQQDLQSILTSLPGQAISQNPEFQPTTGQTLAAGQNNAALAAAPNPGAAALAGLAATGAGYNVGAGSAAPTGFGAPAVPASTTFASPWSTQPSVAYGSGVNQGNAPGSAGALSDWNSVYSSILTPSTTTPSTVTASNQVGTPTNSYAGSSVGIIEPGQTTVTDPNSIYYGMTQDEMDAAEHTGDHDTGPDRCRKRKHTGRTDDSEDDDSED